MGFILKALVTFIIVVLGYNYVVNNTDLIDSKINDVRRDATEFVNPALKEERLLGDVDDNLGLLSTYVDQLTQEDIENARQQYQEDNPDATIVSLEQYKQDDNLSDDVVVLPATVEEAQELITSSQDIVDEIEDIAQQKASTISSSVGRVQELITEVIPSTGTVETLSFTDDEGNAYVCELEK